MAMFLRAFLLALGFLVSAIASAAVAPEPVGFEEIRVPNGDEPPLVGGVWYPSTGVAIDKSVDGNVQSVVPSGAVAGGKLPLVVMSHGGGGSFGGHYDTALALARAGFVVAAISHAGDTSDDQSKVLELWRRPQQLSRLVDYMLGGWSGHSRIDAHRIGAYGFSNGGFTVVVTAGGIPKLSKIDEYCAANPTHDLCTALAQAGVKSVAALEPSPNVWKADPRIGAVAAAAPAFGFTFDTAGLKQVRIPVMLWRPEDDRHQPNPYYEEAIRKSLPRSPEYRVAKAAGHYAFLPPCNERLAKYAPEICTDAAGFNRTAFHKQLNDELIRFFNKALR